MGDDLFGPAFILLVLVIVVFVFIRIAMKLRKYGGSLTTLTFGSTFEFLNKDRQRAVKEMLNLQANKKMDEQKSDEPEDKLFDK